MISHTSLCSTALRSCLNQGAPFFSMLKMYSPRHPLVSFVILAESIKDDTEHETTNHASKSASSHPCEVVARQIHDLTRFQLSCAFLKTTPIARYRSAIDNQKPVDTLSSYLFVHSCRRLLPGTLQGHDLALLHVPKLPRR